MVAEEDAKKATDRIVDIQGQEAKSEKATDVVLRRLANMSRCVHLLKENSLLLSSQFKDMKKARDAAVLDLDGRLKEAQALTARVRRLCDELNSSKRCESTNCDPESTTHKVADALLISQT